jgi:hypothetical protein
MFFTDKIQGTIGQLRLQDWWLSTFTEEEQKYIIQTYQPLGVGDNIVGDSLIKGDGDCNPNAVSILSDLATWFKKEIDHTIGFRIIAKAEESINSSTNILDIHFLYNNKISLYYRFRDSEPNALEEAISACKKQIEISAKAKVQFKKEYKKSPLPSHTGFEQLAIIEEKRGNFKSCIDISTTALKEGWSGDWENRIERVKRKIDKLK